MNKTFLKLILAVNVLLLATLAVFILLAELYPFSPGDILYPLQETAEQTRLKFVTGRTAHAGRAVLMAERRLADLAMAENPNQVEIGGLAFDRALRQAVEAIEDAPESDQGNLYARMQKMLIQAQVVVRSLEFYVDVDLIDSLQDKLGRMQFADTPGELVELALRDIEAAPVPFWEEDVDHDMYPLDGGHSNLECDECHDNGLYTNTPTECSRCHQARVDFTYINELMTGNLLGVAYKSEPVHTSPSFIYPEHFEGECSGCHTVYSWTPNQFDHVGVTECQSCHTDDIPTSPGSLYSEFAHYPGDCKLCHQDVEDWSQTDFDHQLAPNGHDCYACHEKDLEGDHYYGDCVDCHINLDDWGDIYYGHDQGNENCLTCHQYDDPDKHYPGQCSGCHGVDNWSVVNFMHPPGNSDCNSCHQFTTHYPDMNCAYCHVGETGITVFRHYLFDDCTSCHMTPNEHYGPNCTDCHSGESWSSVSYDHSYDIDCLSCHEDLSPVDHYIGDCQSCHTTHNWLDYTFDHTNYQDCQDCHFSSGHYPGQCSNCHHTGNWSEVEVDHSFYQECNVCHQSPSGHWPGQCSSCHNTGAWEDYTFNHTGYTNCRACHTDERPPNHPRGQCDRCHDTGGWSIDPPTDDPLVSGDLNVSAMKDRFTPLNKISELFASIGLRDMEELENLTMPAPSEGELPNLQKTPEAGELPELPGDPELPNDPELPMNGPGLGNGSQQGNGQMFQLAQSVLQTQAWQQFIQEVGDVAPVDLPAVEIMPEVEETNVPNAPPSPEQPSTVETPEP